MPSPFPETADELRERARSAAAPAQAYGYFLAKTRERHGDETSSERCMQLWQAHEASARSATDLAVWEGVSSWTAADGVRQTRLIHRKADTGEVAVQSLDA